MTKNGIRVACAALAFSTLACGQAAGNAPAPGTSVSIEVGKSAPYRLYTHCGVLSATINGQTFSADPILSDGNGNPPMGWGNPFDDGVMTVRTATTADFRDAKGHAAHFTTTARGPAPPPQTCS